MVPISEIVNELPGVDDHSCNTPRILEEHAEDGFHSGSGDGQDTLPGLNAPTEVHQCIRPGIWSELVDRFLVFLFGFRKGHYSNLTATPKDVPDRLYKIAEISVNYPHRLTSQISYPHLYGVDG